jgi:hypothetical protein
LMRLDHAPMGAVQIYELKSGGSWKR